MPSEKVEPGFKEFFLTALRTTPLLYQEAIHDYWNRLGGFSVYTNPDYFYAPIEYAGTVGVIVMFDLEKISDKENPLMEVVYHELFHVYALSKRKQSIVDWQDRRIKKINHAEKETIRQSKKWVRDLRENKANQALLMADSWLKRQVGRFDLSPLSLEETSKI